MNQTGHLWGLGSSGGFLVLAQEAWGQTRPEADLELLDSTSHEIWLERSLQTSSL